MSGLLFSAISSISSSWDFAGASLSLSLAVGGLLSDLASGSRPWLQTKVAAVSSAAGASRLIHNFRITFLLFTGVLDRHEQPFVVARRGGGLFRCGVEGAAVAAHGGKWIVFLLEVGVSGPTREVGPLLRPVAVDGLPL